MEEYTTFGNWLRRRRKICNLTQEKLARLALYDLKMIQFLESDDRRPSKAGAFQLAMALDIPQTYQAIFVQVALGERPLTDLPLPDHMNNANTDVTFARPLHSSYAYLVRKSKLHIISGKRAPHLRGRKKALTAIQEALNTYRCVVIQGFGGSGKTTLAVEVLYDAVDRGLEPAIWVEVGEDTAHDIFYALATLFNIEQEVYRQHIEVQARTICDVLFRENVQLIVLDDVRDTGVLTTLVNALPPNIRFLITSQYRYPLDNSPIVELGPLEEEDAVALLSEHAQKDYSRSRIAHDLCGLLGYLPLAIKMSGKDLRVTKRSIEQYVEDIREFPSNVKMPLDMESQGHRSIRAVIETGLKQLDNKSRQLFLAFGGLSAGSATQDLLELYLKRYAKEISAILDNLYQRGLIEADNTDTPIQYKLHSLSFSYVRSLFEDVNYKQIVRACWEYIKKHSDNVKALDAERPNWLGAAARASKEPLIEMMALLASEGPYLAARGYDRHLLEQLDRAIRVIQTMDDQTKKADDWRTEHFLLSKRGNAHYNHNELTQALARYRAALQIAHDLHMMDREIILMGVISKVYSDFGALGEEGALETAFEYLADARRLTDQLDDSERLLLRILENEGYYYARGRQDLTRAHATYEHMRKLAEQVEDDDSLLYALTNLGAVAHDMTHYSTALHLFEQAHELATRLDIQPVIAELWLSIASTYDELKRREDATEYFRRAHDLFCQCEITLGLAKVEQEMQTRSYPLDSLNPCKEK